ncbi:uncharacterized protein LOC135961508 [Calliphora vicina]|uniref:uncharacterized protein LOC135961508 n=1 Tax=Calliphora vicina TaxID=7373 RepID=UPI00325B7D2E
MKCLSRSTLGIVIGAINIFVYATTFIYILTVLSNLSGLSEKEKERIDNVLTTSVPILLIFLGICVFGIIIAGLLIAGIIKRRHSLMTPWIYSSVVGIVCEGFLLVIGFVMDVINGQPAVSVFSSFIFGIFTLGIQIFIFYFIYKLYKDIRDTKTENDQSGGEIEAK